MFQEMRRRIWRCLLFSSLLGVGGCWLVVDPDVCHTGIFFDVSPPQATIAVGESFAPSATVESCPEGVRDLSLFWTAEDPSIVLIEAGRVTGLKEGETVVKGGDDQENVLVTIAVTVLPDP
jgi:hypothetical protein